MKKKCKKCKQNLEHTYFNINKKSKDGLQYKCKKCINEYNNEWKNNNLSYQKEYYLKTCDVRKEIYREQNPQFVKKNKEQIREYNRNYYRIKKEKDPFFKLKCSLRVRTHHAFKRKKWNKNSKNEHLLGCKFEDLKNHIEKQFTSGMTWNNYGKWHIDHIIPLDIAKSEKELLPLLHYTNLQPLWALDNIKKGNQMQKETLLF
jgi:hypothetical protein